MRTLLEAAFNFGAVNDKRNVFAFEGLNAGVFTSLITFNVNLQRIWKWLCSYDAIQLSVSVVLLITLLRFCICASGWLLYNPFKYTTTDLKLELSHKKVSAL